MTISYVFVLQATLWSMRRSASCPLESIMMYEKKGGWGRSVRGAEKAVAKFMANEATKADGMDLSQHLEYVQACRSLQPDPLKTLLPERLEAVIKLSRKPRSSLQRRCFSTWRRKRASASQC